MNLGAVTVVGYDGNEIVIKNDGKTKDEQTDARAKGLKRIGTSGYEISPGVGITAVEREGVVEIEQLENIPGVTFVIMLPKSMSVSLSNNNSLTAGLIKFSNINGEIEINAPYNRIELEGVTGPLTVSNIAEPIQINFAKKH